MESAVKVSGLEVRFGRTPALANLSFEVKSNELFFVLGASGSGKTTLLRVLAGLTRPNAGKVELFGKTVNDPAIRVLPESRQTQLVFQSFALWPHMTLKAHLRFASGGRKSDQAWLDELLELTRLDGLTERYPSQLSGGEQQRLALARALASRPRLLLMDEPLRNLDPSLSRDVRREIQSILHHLGITTIYVTHEQEETFEMADRVMLLERGRLAALGEPLELYHNPPNAHTARFLGRANLVETCVDETGAAPTPLGTIEKAGSPGAAVTVRFCPEDLRARPAPGPWTVRRWLMLAGGPVLELGHGEHRLLVRNTDDETLGPGDTVRVVVEHDPVVVPAVSLPLGATPKGAGA